MKKQLDDLRVVLLDGFDHDGVQVTNVEFSIRVFCIEIFTEILDVTAMKEKVQSFQNHRRRSCWDLRIRAWAERGMIGRGKNIHRVRKQTVGICQGNALILWDWSGSLMSRPGECLSLVECQEYNAQPR